MCEECSRLRREIIALNAKLKNIPVDEGIPLLDIKLSARTYNALFRAGITAVNELLKINSEELY